MSNIFYILFAVAMGVALAIQPPINATMARGLGSPLLASTISILISLITVIILWLVWGKGSGDFSQLRTLPWWVFIGGLVGALFVAGAVISVPVIGVALFFVCIVAGQLVASAVIDQFGAFGLAVKPLNLMKLAGIVLVLIGAALVQNSNS